MLYTSIENKYIKEIKKLNEKKYRDIKGLYLIEGEHLIHEAYNSGVLDSVLIKEGCNLDLDIKKDYVSLNVLKYISQLDNPSDYIGIVKKQEGTVLGDNIFILDNIQDPGNLGTIIRSAVAFSVDTLIISSDSVDLYNSKVVRATQGMIFKLNIVICDINNIIDNLKESGYKIIGTKVDGGTSLTDFDKSEKMAIIMGNEGNGVKREILDKCDDYIYINMSDKCESLNVGVAASIIMHEMRSK